MQRRRFGSEFKIEAVRLDARTRQRADRIGLPTTRRIMKASLSATGVGFQYPGEVLQTCVGMLLSSIARERGQSS